MVLPFDPFSLLGAISLGIEAVRYAKSYGDARTKRQLAAEFRALYFDRVLFDEIERDSPDWDEIESAALKRLWDSRIQVSDALVRMEEDGFLNTLSLKQQRMFQDLTRSKRIIRSELVDAIRSGDLRCNREFRDDLLNRIGELNRLIEDLESAK